MSLEMPCIYYRGNGLCRYGGDESEANVCGFGPCEYETPSRGDIIRKMNDDELGSFLYSLFECGDCTRNSECECGILRKGSDGWRNWLREPALTLRPRRSGLTMRKITPGLYRHFKGNMYRVAHIATHTETGEKMVVYQALYGDFGYYVRPYDMFASEVDREKYPDVTQQYRFEKVETPPPELMFADVKCPRCGAICDNEGHEDVFHCSCGWTGKIDEHKKE